MFPFLRLGRRKFLRDCAVGLAAAPLVSRASEFSVDAGVQPKTTGNSLPAEPVAHSNNSVWILRGKDADFAEVLASRELARGLRNLGFAGRSVQVAAGAGEVPSTATVFFLSTDAQRFKGPEGYEIIQGETGDKPARVRIVGAKSQAVLYAVFDFLERQGALFGLDGEVYPLDAPTSLQLPGAGRSWLAQPRFPVRGLLPWPDFLNCVTVYNREDWRAYLEAMVRMRFNTLGVHVYTSEEQWVEPFLSLAYCGVGHQAFLDTTATNRWGYLPQRTSQYGMGSADFFAGEVFGADSAINARNCWEAQENAQKVWREAFSYAKQLGIRTGVGFEPYRIPDEILRAAPPEAMYLPAAAPADPALSPRIGPRIDPESVAARDILETRLARLLEAYPSVNYVWLWEDEQMNWASQKSTIPISVTPFRQAYDFLKRHAPEKRLVISGWGGVVRHFAYLHAQLPEDIVFSSLNDNVGWDAVHEAFGKLENRERWAIPWLEDDPAMWLPQFHVHRIQRDMDLAEQYGCQGLMGIHWRHRIVDADATFQSRYSWNKDLTPKAHFQAFASVQAREKRAETLSTVLEETDRDRLILCSWTGGLKDGHSEIHEFSGDYDEAFQFWEKYLPPSAIQESQAFVAKTLRGLTDAASSAAERERLNYLTRYIELLVPYSDSWCFASDLNQVLRQASALKRENDFQEARDFVLNLGMPLWLKIAPLVREALLNFQEIVSTRNDQGQLASMHNKYERLALYRLRASMKEFLGDLPPQVEQMFAEVRGANLQAAPRVFVPTRPTLLQKTDEVRIQAVVPGGTSVRNISLYTRTAERRPWSASPMRLEQRRTYEGKLRWERSLGQFLDYYVGAEVVTSGAIMKVTAPAEAPSRHYTVTLL